MEVKRVISKAVVGTLTAALAAGALAVSGCSNNGDAGEPKAPPPKAAQAPAPMPSEIPGKAAPPAAEAAPAGAVGDRAETDSYVVEIVEPPQVAAGAESAVSVVVKPKGIYHFNLEFPTSVTIEAPSGASVAKARQDLKDAVSSSEEQGATWQVKVTPTEPGAKTFKADLKFAVCTDTTCDPKKETLAFSLDVK